VRLLLVIFSVLNSKLSTRYFGLIKKATHEFSVTFCLNLNQTRTIMSVEPESKPNRKALKPPRKAITTKVGPFLYRPRLNRADPASFRRDPVLLSETIPKLFSDDNADVLKDLINLGFLPKNQVAIVPTAKEEIEGHFPLKPMSIFGLAVFYNSVECMKELLRAFPTDGTNFAVHYAGVIETKKRQPRKQLKLAKGEQAGVGERLGEPGANVTDQAKEEHLLTTYEYALMNVQKRSSVLSVMNQFLVERHWHIFRQFLLMKKEQNIISDLSPVLMDKLLFELAASELTPRDKESYNISAEYVDHNS